MTGAETEVVNRAGILQNSCFSIPRTFRAKAIEVQARSLGRKEHAEIEHLSRPRVKFRMRRKRAGLIQASVKSERTSCFQRLWIKLPGQALFAQCQQAVTQGIDADVDRRFQPILYAIELAVFKCGAEGAKQGSPGLLFAQEFCATNVTALEMNAVFMEVQGTNHAVTVEPVLV